MERFRIGRAMFDDIDYDVESDNNNAGKRTVDLEPMPTLFIVFSKYDVYGCVAHIMRSLERPFNSEAVATVVVHESVKEELIEKLQAEFKPYGKAILEDDKIQNFKKALEAAKKLNARIVTIENAEEDILGPTLVCDFNHEQLGFNEPSGVITLHSFRTAREAVKVINKEPILFSMVSLWSENHTSAYEVIALLKFPYYFINCMRNFFTTFQCIEGKENFVHMDDCYHYEILNHKYVTKVIIFPVGSKFEE